MTHVIIRESVSCVFVFRCETDEYFRCAMRYYSAKRNPVKDRCCKRWCPLRKADIIVKMSQNAWDKDD